MEPPLARSTAGVITLHQAHWLPNQFSDVIFPAFTPRPKIKTATKSARDLANTSARQDSNLRCHVLHTGIRHHFQRPTSFAETTVSTKRHTLKVM